MAEFGVPADTQDRLIEEALEGVVHQADEPDATPINIEKSETAEATFETLTFDDGSIRVVEREKPVEVKGEIGALAVTGCSTSGTTHFTSYSNCKVHYRSAVFSYGFYTNFTIYESGNDRINWVGNMFHEYSIGHARLSWRVGINRATQSGSSEAYATQTIEYRIEPYIGQITRGVRICVGGNRYYQQNHSDGC